MRNWTAAVTLIVALFFGSHILSAEHIAPDSIPVFDGNRARPAPPEFARRRPISLPS